MYRIVYIFFNDTATTEIYTLSLHDALPIWRIAEWGTGALLDVVAPSMADDRGKRAWLAKLERLSSSPGSLRALLESTVDVRDDLARVCVPALVLHRTGDRLVDVAHGRYVAE